MNFIQRKLWWKGVKDCEKCVKEEGIDKAFSDWVYRDWCKSYKQGRWDYILHYSQHSKRIEGSPYEILHTDSIAEAVKSCSTKPLLDAYLPWNRLNKSL